MLQRLEADEQWAAIYGAADDLAISRGEWAGYPKLIPGQPVLVEPTHEWAKRNGTTVVTIDGPSKERGWPEGVTVVNSWHSEGKNATVYVLDVDGRRRAWWCRDQGWPTRLLTMALPALGVANYCDWEAEEKAVQLLRGMVSETQFNQYVLTGSFLESSSMSGVKYLFRKGRPTVALGTSKSGNVGFLAALCLHPLGYYKGTWMGAMVPTDDVIAHLVLMRGDEPMLWRKATHHPAHSAAAGL